MGRGACRGTGYNPWGCKELDTAEQLNNNNFIFQMEAWSWASSLQNCEEMNLCCLQPPNVLLFCSGTLSRLRLLVQRNLQSRANLAPPLRHFLSEESPGCVKRRSFHPAFSQFSRSVVFDSLRPHESQHARPPCPSQTPRVYSNSCPSSQWSHPAISSSIVPFSSCPQSLPASGSFPMSQLFTWGCQSIGVSALASVLPMNTQDWSSLGWTCWISLQSKGLSRVFSNTTVQKHQFFTAQLSHPYMTTGKIIALTGRAFVGKVISLLFNMLSRLVIAFLPRSKHLLISWLQSPSAVILEPPKIKSVTVSIVSPSVWHEVMRL